ncbi:MAG: hypothetical protein ACREID_07420, partial [Planctomycetota bacterium]
GPDGAPAPDPLQALRRFQERGEVRFLDVGEDRVENAGVVDLAPRDRAVVAGVPATFVATVRNHGSEPLSNLSVVFRFGEHVEMAQRVAETLPPNGEAQVGKEYTFRGDGPAVVTAEIPTDALPGDDARRLVVEVRPRMRFLLVDGEPAQEAYRGEADYLAAALAVPGDVQSGIDVDVLPEHAFSGRELQSYDGVFLCNVYRLPDDRLQRLEEFVRAGGGLFFFLGDQVDPQVYNANFYREGKGVLPLPVEDAEGSSEEYVGLAPPSLDHPVVRFLRGVNEAVLRTVAFQRYLRCGVPARSDARVVLAYADEAGSPALAERSFGEGRVLLFTSAADVEWSNFPLSPVYLALLQEAARYIVRPDAGGATLPVLAPIEVAFDPTRMRRQATVVPPPELGG